MSKKAKSIPVNPMVNDFDTDISIERIVIEDLLALDKKNLTGFEAENQSHRHDRHSFFLLESGTVELEIDFKTYTIEPSTIIYIHPDQVHQTTAFKNVIVSSWAINNERLNPEYLKLLEGLKPVMPLVLEKEIALIFSETVSLFLKFAKRNTDKLYHDLLRDSCNALVALVISQYLGQAKPTDKVSRFELVTSAFREVLEQNYAAVKSPAAYAEKLNLSTAYLNECVKNATGYPVSYHIQQRVILEAKRLLYHSSKSVKEIAFELGYNDYPYFSRLFAKLVGTTALAFRNKNLN